MIDTDPRRLVDTADYRLAQQLRNRIAFRLDPQKPDHVRLGKHVDALANGAGSYDSDKQAVRALTIQILEAEWRRVRTEAAGKALFSRPEQDG